MEVCAGKSTLVGVCVRLCTSVYVCVRRLTGAILLDPFQQSRRSQDTLVHGMLPLVIKFVAWDGMLHLCCKDKDLVTSLHDLVTTFFRGHIAIFYETAT